jgi:hypothetical protein
MGSKRRLFAEGAAVVKSKEWDGDLGRIKASARMKLLALDWQRDWVKLVMPSNRRNASKTDDVPVPRMNGLEGDVLAIK